jgi:hypothetical protein
MIKQLLSGGSFFALLLASSLSAQAQIQQPAPKPQAPAAPQVQIDAEELQKFANAIKQLQVIQQESITEMTQVVQREGLSEQRFMQIYQTQQNPSAQPTAKITPEEQQNFEQASTRIREIEQQTQSKMEKSVENAGLNVQRFNQIMVAVRQDPALQQKVQQMIQS